MSTQNGAATRPRFRRHIAAGAFAAAISIFPLHAQNPPTPSASQQLPAFDVATIKPGSVGSDGMRFVSLNVSPDGEVRITNWTLKALICAAYNMGWWQIQGGPAWIEKDEFDVTAKPPAPANGDPPYNIHHDNWTFDDPALREMLQALLRDRFALKTHLSTKEGTVYILEKGDGELALTPSKHPSGNGGFGGVGLGMNYGRVMVNASITSLTGYLSSYVLHQPVIDKTNLIGTYDFTTKNIPAIEELSTSGSNAVDTTVMLRYVKEMGPELTKTTGPVTTLVIDQASAPSPN